MMRFSSFITSLFVLVMFWLAGIEMGIAQTIHTSQENERPYWRIMQDDVAQLLQAGFRVKNPATLPPIYMCSRCLNQREAFGAYIAKSNQIIVPDNFDINSLQSRAALAHEYGHYLLTQAGVPEDSQEKLCLALGNMSYQKIFTTASE